jgi:diphosphomevalonate decarboxylase
VCPSCRTQVVRGEADALVVEGNCLAMHADAMAARPGVIYFGPTTLWAIDRVRALRAEGVPVFFTVDAGPHLVAFTPPAHLARVAEALRAHEGLADVLTSGVGPGAHRVDGAR